MRRTTRNRCPMPAAYKAKLLYEIMGYFVRCPTCKIEGIADIGKYKKILENKMTEGASTRKSCPP